MSNHLPTDDLAAAQRLRDQSRALLDHEAFGEGEPAVRAQRAAALNAAADALADTSDEAARTLLVEATRYLTAIRASQTPPVPDPTLLAEARALTQDVQRIALAIVAGEIPRDEAVTRGQAFRYAIGQLLGRAAELGIHDEIAQAVHDADLDADFVASGGLAPTSLSLAAMLRAG